MPNSLPKLALMYFTRSSALEKPPSTAYAFGRTKEGVQRGEEGWDDWGLCLLILCRLYLNGFLLGPLPP